MKQIRILYNVLIIDVSVYSNLNRSLISWNH